MGDISNAVAMVCVALIDLITLAMSVRAVMSWIVDESNAIHGFFISITEPFIIPVRKLFDRFSIGRGMSIDMPFMTTLLLLIIVKTILDAYF